MSAIKRAEATYTGGGIYIYTGKLASGEYFLTDDECGDDCVYVLDADPYRDLERACHDDWQTAHTLYIVTADEAAELFKQILTQSEMLDYDRDARLAKLA